MLLENLNEDIRSCLIRFLYSVQDQLISILIVILILLESESSDTFKAPIFLTEYAQLSYLF